MFTTLIIVVTENQARSGARRDETVREEERWGRQGRGAVRARGRQGRGVGKGHIQRSRKSGEKEDFKVIYLGRGEE